MINSTLTKTNEILEIKTLQFPAVSSSFSQCDISEIKPDPNLTYHPSLFQVSLLLLKVKTQLHLADAEDRAGGGESDEEDKIII